MKNKILKGITAVAAVLFLISVCFLDSESNVPCIVCVVCLVWIALFMIANRERLGYYE